MTIGNYPRKFFKSRTGQLYIVISEALLLAEDNNFDFINIRGGAKIFPEKFVTNKVKEFVNEKNGILWKDKSRYDKNKLIELAKKAKYEVSDKEYGPACGKLLEFVIYERIKPEKLNIKEEKEEPIEDIIKRAEEADKIRRQRREERHKNELKKEKQEMQKDVNELKNLEF